MKMTLFSRRAALTAISALALTACGAANGDNGATPTNGTDTTTVPVQLGHSKGNPDAAVQVIEYASPTCPACKSFNETVMPAVNENYIATGKINFTYREYPLNQIDVVAYALAHCAGSDKYFDVLDDLFASQDGIRAAARAGVVEDTLAEIGARHGVTDYEGCKNNAAVRQKIADNALSGEQFGVSGTPTFIINGTVHKYDATTGSVEGFTGLLDEQLAAAGQ